MKVRARQVKRHIASTLRRQEQDFAIRVGSLRAGIAQTALEVRDAVDASVDSLSQHVGASVLEATALTARGIESALHRLSRGGYGKCVDCDSEIAAARLRALPFAIRCRSCQEQVEGVAVAVPA
jgi:DnaK suppressor protein